MPRRSHQGSEQTNSGEQSRGEAGSAESVDEVDLELEVGAADDEVDEHSIVEGEGGEREHVVSSGVIDGEGISASQSEAEESDYEEEVVSEETSAAIARFLEELLDDNGQVVSRVRAGSEPPIYRFLHALANSPSRILSEDEASRISRRDNSASSHEVAPSIEASVSSRESALNIAGGAEVRESGVARTVEAAASSIRVEAGRGAAGAGAGATGEGAAGAAVESGTSVLTAVGAEEREGDVYRDYDLVPDGQGDDDYHDSDNVSLGPDDEAGDNVPEEEVSNNNLVVTLSRNIANAQRRHEAAERARRARQIEDPESSMERGRVLTAISHFDSAVLPYVSSRLARYAAVDWHSVLEDESLVRIYLEVRRVISYARRQAIERRDREDLGAYARSEESEDELTAAVHPSPEFIASSGGEAADREEGSGDLTQSSAIVDISSSVRLREGSPEREESSLGGDVDGSAIPTVPDGDREIANDDESRVVIGQHHDEVLSVRSGSTATTVDVEEDLDVPDESAVRALTDFSMLLPIIDRMLGDHSFEEAEFECDDTGNISLDDRPHVVSRVLLHLANRILRDIIEDEVIPSGTREWLEENRERLLIGTCVLQVDVIDRSSLSPALIRYLELHDGVVEHSRTLLTGDHTSIVAWRNFDFGNSIASNSFGNPFNPADTRGFFYSLQGTARNHGQAAIQCRAMLAGYFLGIHTEEHPDSSGDRWANVLGQLADIRRAHNEEDGPYDHDSLSCYPGAVGRVSAMGNTHPIIQMPMELSEAVAITTRSVLTNAIYEYFSRFEESDYETKLQLYLALMAFSAFNADDIVSHEMTDVYGVPLNLLYYVRENFFAEGLFGGADIILEQVEYTIDQEYQGRELSDVDRSLVNLMVINIAGHLAASIRNNFFRILTVEERERFDAAEREFNTIAPLISVSREDVEIYVAYSEQADSFPELETTGADELDHSMFLENVFNPAIANLLSLDDYSISSRESLIRQVRDQALISQYRTEMGLLLRLRDNATPDMAAMLTDDNINGRILHQISNRVNSLWFNCFRRGDEELDLPNDYSGETIQQAANRLDLRRRLLDVEVRDRQRQQEESREVEAEVAGDDDLVRPVRSYLDVARGRRNASSSLADVISSVRSISSAAPIAEMRNIIRDTGPVPLLRITNVDTVPCYSVLNIPRIPVLLPYHPTGGREPRVNMGITRFLVACNLEARRPELIHRLAAIVIGGETSAEELSSYGIQCSLIVQDYPFANEQLLGRPHTVIHSTAPNSGSYNHSQNVHFATIINGRLSISREQQVWTHSQGGMVVYSPNNMGVITPGRDDGVSEAQHITTVYVDTITRQIYLVSNYILPDRTANILQAGIRVLEEPLASFDALVAWLGASTPEVDWSNTFPLGPITSVTGTRSLDSASSPLSTLRRRGEAARVSIERGRNWRSLASDDGAAGATIEGDGEIERRALTRQNSISDITTVIRREPITSDEVSLTAPASPRDTSILRYRRFTNLGEVNCYRELSLPRAPMLLPYHPAGSSEATQRINSGITRIPTAIQIDMSRYPNSTPSLDMFMRQVGGEHDLRDFRLEQFVVIQDCPFRNENLILRPHSWIHPEAPASGSHNEDDIVSYFVINSNGVVHSRRFLSERVWTHSNMHGDIVYSPESAAIVIASADGLPRDRLLATVIIDARRQRIAVTTHVILTDDSYDNYANRMRDITSETDNISDVISLLQGIECFDSSRHMPYALLSRADFSRLGLSRSRISIGRRVEPRPSQQRFRPSTSAAAAADADVPTMLALASSNASRLLPTTREIISVDRSIRNRVRETLGRNFSWDRLERPIAADSIERLGNIRVEATDEERFLVTNSMDFISAFGEDRLPQVPTFLSSGRPAPSAIALRYPVASARLESLPAVVQEFIRNIGAGNYALSAYFNIQQREFSSDGSGVGAISIATAVSHIEGNQLYRIIDAHSNREPYSSSIEADSVIEVPELTVALYSIVALPIMNRVIVTSHVLLPEELFLALNARLSNINIDSSQHDIFGVQNLIRDSICAEDFARYFRQYIELDNALLRSIPLNFTNVSRVHSGAELVYPSITNLEAISDSGVLMPCVTTIRAGGNRYYEAGRTLDYRVPVAIEVDMSVFERSLVPEYVSDFIGAEVPMGEQYNLCMHYVIQSSPVEHGEDLLFAPEAMLATRYRDYQNALGEYSLVVQMSPDIGFRRGLHDRDDFSILGDYSRNGYMASDLSENSVIRIVCDRREVRIESLMLIRSDNPELAHQVVWTIHNILSMDNVEELEHRINAWRMIARDNSLIISSPPVSFNALCLWFNNNCSDLPINDLPMIYRYVHGIEASSFVSPVQRGLVVLDSVMRRGQEAPELIRSLFISHYINSFASRELSRAAIMSLHDILAPQGREYELFNSQFIEAAVRANRPDILEVLRELSIETNVEIGDINSLLLSLSLRHSECAVELLVANGISRFNLSGETVEQWCQRNGLSPILSEVLNTICHRSGMLSPRADIPIEALMESHHHDDTMRILFRSASMHDTATFISTYRTAMGAIRGRIYQGDTLLTFCARMGASDFISYLVDHGEDPNMQRPGDGSTPLHIAVERGDLTMFRLLAARESVNLDIENHLGFTVHQLAEHLSMSEICAELAEAGPEPMDMTDDPRHSSARIGSVARRVLP